MAGAVAIGNLRLKYNSKQQYTVIKYSLDNMKDIDLVNTIHAMNEPICSNQICFQ